MITERLSSGLPTTGRSELLGSEKNLGKSEQKGPDGFADVLKTAKTPQKDRPAGGKIEDSPRTKEDLAVKDRKNQDDEPVTEKTDGSRKVEKKLKAEKPQPKATKRQQAMQEFMDSMESEFGIPPERIAEAMVSLKVQDLEKSPEETASQVIQKLNLEPEQESKAEALYVSMLTKLSSPEMLLEQPTVKPAQTLPTHEQMALMQMQAQVGAPVAGPKLQPQTPSSFVASEKQRRVQLNESLDRLSQKFFLTGSEGSRTAERMMEPQLAAQNQLNPMLAENKQPMVAYLDQKGALDLGDLGVVRPDQQLPDATYKELANKLAVLEQSSRDLGMPKALKSVEVEQALQNQIAQGDLSPSQVMMMRSSAEMGSEFGPEMKGHQQSKNDFETLSSAQGDTKSGEFFAQPQATEKSIHRESAPIAAAGSGSIRPQQTETSIQQIMNQAQYMMKKGGGESIVKLSPEGLGDLHLKVTVQDGKVNLTMAAETKEAKSLIENNLGDLKSSLGTHNLKVESVKVDVGNQLSSDNNNSNAQTGFKFDQSREQARQFLGNFREENANSRGFFHESPALKAYGAPKGPEPLKPSEEAKSRARRYVGEGRGNGLSLVA